MTNIGDINAIIDFITNKVGMGYVNPTEKSYALDFGQQEIFRYFVPLYLEAGDDYASTALNPFKKSTPITSNGAGLLSYPADFGDTEAIYDTVYGKLVTPNTVMHNELQDALDSVLYPIEVTPRFIEESAGIQLYPTTSRSIILHYLSKPTTPVIGFTVVGNTIVYDPLTSVQLQFSNQYWTQIIQKALPYIGVNLSSQEVASLSSLFYQENGAAV